MELELRTNYTESLSGPLLAADLSGMSGVKFHDAIIAAEQMLFVGLLQRLAMLYCAPLQLRRQVVLLEIMQERFEAFDYPA